MNITHLCVSNEDISLLPLQDDGIHLWSVTLDDFLADRSQLEDILSPDERARALRFVFDEHRNQYIIRRGLLRQLLSQYTDHLPHEMIFSYNSHGKPILADGPSFNLAYSGSRAVFAVTLTQAIGVDIERIRLTEDLPNLAPAFLSERELLHFLALPANLQPQAFYIYWTCKEAILKARGCGLSAPMKSLEVRLAQNLTPTILSIYDFSMEPSEWWLESYESEGSYRVSIAGEFIR